MLDKIDYSKLQTPGLSIENTKIDRWDAFKMAKLQKYRVKQNSYLQIYDKKAKSDITVIPLEISANFHMAIIASYQLKFGPINQLNFRDLEATVNMGEC